MASAEVWLTLTEKNTTKARHYLPLEDNFIFFFFNIVIFFSKWVIPSLFFTLFRTLDSKKLQMTRFELRIAWFEKQPLYKLCPTDLQIF